MNFVGSKKGIQKIKFGVIRRYSIVGGRRLSNYLWAAILFLGGCGFLLTGISSFFNRNIKLLMPTADKLNLVSTDQPFSLFLRSISVLSEKLFQTWPSKIMSYVASFVSSVSTWQDTSQSTLSAGHHVLDKKLLFGSQSWPIGHSDNIVNSMRNIHQVISENPISDQENTLVFFPQGLVLSFYGFLGVSFSFHLLGNLFWEIGGGFNEFHGKDKYVRVFRWGRPGKNRRIDLKYTSEFIENIKVELVPRPALFLHLKGEKNIPLTRIGEFIPLEELEAQAAELTSLLQVPLKIEN